MKRLVLCLLVICITVLFIACSKQDANAKISIGIISPSIDHLPLSVAIDKRYLDNNTKVVRFTSGWELQEAIAAGKIDLAIMPFTYAWTAIAKGTKLKIISCLERETDGIVAGKEFSGISELHDKKIGLLRASTLEVLMQDAAAISNINYRAVYFRTPTEMVEALKAKQVDAIVSYVPLIQKLGAEYHVVQWFSEANQAHPCCDLVATQSVLSKNTAVIKKIQAALEKAILDINTPSDGIFKLMNSLYSLDKEQALDALKHTKFDTKTTEADKQFELRMMGTFLANDYIKHMPSIHDVYLKHLPK